MLILDTAAQDEQPRVLASVERVWHAGARPPSETVWLVVVASALPVE
jgi:hypothetical protein